MPAYAQSVSGGVKISSKVARVDQSADDDDAEGRTFSVLVGLSLGC